MIVFRTPGRRDPERVLPQMAQTVAAGTGAEQVVVWLRVDGELRLAASAHNFTPVRSIYRWQGQVHERAALSDTGWAGGAEPGWGEGR